MSQMKDEKAREQAKRRRIQASLDYVDHEIFSFFGDCPLAHGLIGTQAAALWGCSIAAAWLGRSSRALPAPLANQHKKVFALAEESYVEMAKYKAGVMRVRGQMPDASLAVGDLPAGYKPTNSWLDKTIADQKWQEDLSYTACDSFRVHLNSLVARLSAACKTYDPSGGVVDYRYGAIEYRRAVEQAVESHFPDAAMPYVLLDGVPFHLRDEACELATRVFVRLTGFPDKGDAEKFTSDAIRLYDKYNRIATHVNPPPKVPQVATMQSLYEFFTDLTRWAEQGGLGSFSPRPIAPPPILRNTEMFARPAKAVDRRVVMEAVYSVPASKMNAAVVQMQPLVKGLLVNYVDYSNEFRDLLNPNDPLHGLTEHLADTGWREVRDVTLADVLPKCKELFLCSVIRLRAVMKQMAGDRAWLEHDEITFTRWSNDDPSLAAVLHRLKMAVWMTCVRPAEILLRASSKTKTPAPSIKRLLQQLKISPPSPDAISSAELENEAIAITDAHDRAVYNGAATPPTPPPLTDPCNRSAMIATYGDTAAVERVYRKLIDHLDRGLIVGNAVPTKRGKNIEKTYSFPAQTVYRYMADDADSHKK